ncbi:hypothetical protein ES705_17417 [subsurface metagenome]
MLPPDIPVWYRFLKTWGHEVVNLYYDCLLGGPYLSPEVVFVPKYANPLG